MAAQVREYRARIRSAQTTKKITRAMELIAASRIGKAQQRVAAALPFEHAITRAVAAVASFGHINHVLTTERPKPKRAAVVVFTSDRGLAGAFNSNVLRKTDELTALLEREGKEVSYYLVGRKSVGYFRFRGREFVREWVGETDTPTQAIAHEIGTAVVDSFVRGSDDGGVDEIHLVHNEFVSMLVQQPVVIRLLPLEVVEGEQAPEPGAALPLYELEPEGTAVLDALLPVYIESRIYSAMLESAASKHAATQKAMKSASDNADTLIREYTRLANNARQQEITQQISEIIGGADALAG